MTTDAVLITEVEAFLTSSWELPALPASEAVSDAIGDETSELSATPTPEPRKRGQKKSNIDSTVKIELDRAKDRTRCSRSCPRPTWKTIAQRELATRLIAEEQQRQMCEAVETRAAFIRGFQEMIQLQDKVGNFVQRKKIRVEPSDAAFYKAFLQDLDAIYAQTDTVLRACGLELAGEDNVDSKGLWKEDSKTGFFLFTDNTNRL
ncbi:hypothetical protein PC110_g19993 [Phytophthora cactorum]|uniref:Uncharacterized protein n=1 Tax=Phytophthora cactorum TaxID=29920 RepID=A0A329RGS5_9STRA|nr:hypothetical protein PC110_g19993 [Phytophthora cactorum]